jgi:hypothetical protein
MAGLPYGAAVMIIEDGVSRYAVECPVCHETFSGSGKTEDTITKSASRKYADHFVKTHSTD